MLLFTLISLVVMLVAAVALVRSFNNSLFTAGNIAFKRDMQNQAERIVPDIITLMQTGAMGNTTARGTHTPARNYSATILASNPQGIPTALYASDTDFATVGTVSNDVAVTLNSVNQGVSIRYLIDRQCRTTGDEALLGTDNCIEAPDGGVPTGGSSSQQSRAEVSVTGADDAASAAGATNPTDTAGGAGKRAVVPQIIYRLSIRVTGPRNTQSFFQTTFTL